jgi:hypothetical protein
MKVFTHSSIDVKSVPTITINSDVIDRFVSLLERLEVACGNKIELWSNRLERPLKCLIYSIGASIVLYTSHLVIKSLRSTKDKKQQ